MESDERQLENLISTAMKVDQFSLRRFLRSIQRAEKQGKPQSRNLEKFRRQLEASQKRREERHALVPKINWPNDLPVVARREEISAAMRDSQVIVVCGETGSGKSTQLPKIALDLGRGIGGVIGHTQPRRIAARSVASRIAEELNVTPGKEVGYRIRFNDSSGPHTLIRLMTDGIMLAETQSDPFLDQYDTIIVDEAHERSLNIDFLLGYLKRLLPKRPDLRLVITSATIDAQRFAEHFGSADAPAPVIQVEGRTFPVELRYRGPEWESTTFDAPVLGSSAVQDKPDRDWLDSVSTAIDELADEGSGHILVFLPTERDIREADKHLSGRRYPGDTAKHPTQIVPLFGRLSMADQTKVFQPYQHRRIVLATNVAESSLTVPGIRYVVDTGTARISRYSARSRMQRLPVEPVSQASANQRAGRCGRIAPGICIRLYDEDDYQSRDPFTAPEIQRTNLAAVILRTMNLRLGLLEDFPFIDPPRPTTIREGYKTLEELRAINTVGSGQENTAVSTHDHASYELTEIGRQMARLPVDPRISRMILAAIDENSVPEVMVIASALEIQDPRERPIDRQQAADEAHQQFQHEDSDFLTFLNLWDAWHEHRKKLSGSQLRRWCRQNFLSWMRMREWIDVHRQLKDLLTESGDRKLKSAAALHPVRDRRNDYQAIHRALVTGLLANLGFRSGDREYIGAGGNKLAIWPGSALSGKGLKWFVAAELVETSQRFARTLARIQPEWIERLADHLVKREHTEPHWDARAGNVMCFEKVTLWGLPLVARRRVPFARVDSKKCRELLIQHGLVELALLYGNTEDDREADFADEERELLSGNRSRLTPGRILRADPSSRAFRSDEASTRKGWGKDFPFLEHNVRVLQQIKELQARTRRHDLLPNEDVLFELYEQQIPEDVADRMALRRWYRRASRHKSGLLKFDVDTFTSAEERSEGSSDFPATLQIGNLTLPLRYQLEPGTEADGVTVVVPVEFVDQLDQDRLSWLVPGLVEEKVTALIRSLPKDLRRNFVPAPDTGRQVSQALRFGDGNLLLKVAESLSRIAGEPIKPDVFDLTGLPEHLTFNLRAIDSAKNIVAESRAPDQLRKSLLQSVKSAIASESRSEEEKKWLREEIIDWDFGQLPAELTVTRAGMQFSLFPALTENGTTAGLTLCHSMQEAAGNMRKGLRRLLLQQDRDRIRRQVEHLPDRRQLKTMASSVPELNLDEQLSLLMVERAYLSPKDLPRTEAEYRDFQKEGRRRLGVVVQELVQLLPGLFRLYQETSRNLKVARGPGWDFALADMRNQLNDLVHPNFLETTPWPWLIQYSRYFTGIRMRLDRLNSGGLNKERELWNDFVPYYQRYLARREEARAARRTDPMLDHYRWMLEEFRISLFAQKLGTAIKVSGPKLDEHWTRVK